MKDHLPCPYLDTFVDDGRHRRLCQFQVGDADDPVRPLVGNQCGKPLQVTVGGFPTATVIDEDDGTVVIHGPSFNPRWSGREALISRTFSPDSGALQLVVGPADLEGSLMGDLA